MQKKKRTTNQQSVQVIGGTYRHRKINFIEVDDLRPTGARLRETLFNWLQGYLCDANCLDLFAGSGILGLEAISRGAKSVTFVEKDYCAAEQLRENIAILNIVNATVINSDFCDALQGQFDIIFLDPPYTLRLLPELLDAIKPLNPKWIFIEDNESFNDWVSARGDYDIIKNKKAGNIYYGLLQLLKA